MDYLRAVANVASIATAVVAVYGYGHYRYTRHRRTRDLETLLEKKNQPRDDTLTLDQLAAELGLTNEQVIDAASRSKRIEPWAGQTGAERRFQIKRKQSEVRTRA